MGHEDIFRRVFERAIAGLYRTTPDGIILDCNIAFAKVLGFESVEEIKRVNAKTLYFGDAAERERNLARLKIEGAVTSGEVRMRRRDGTPVWVLFSEHLEGDGVIEGTLLDVTDHKELELRLLQLEKLAAIGTLAGGVAHEVNNPLSYAMANVTEALRHISALRAEAPAPLAVVLDVLQPLLEDAHHGHERVRLVVRELQAQARRESGERTTVNLQRLLDACVGTLAPELKRRAEVRRDYQPTPDVVGDEATLRQAYLHLMGSLLRSMEPGQAPHVLELRTFSAPGAAVVQVLSSGSLDPAEFQARLTRPPPGSGMGVNSGFELRVSRATIEGLGGSISARPNPSGRGVLVEVSIPSLEG